MNAQPRHAEKIVRVKMNTPKPGMLPVSISKKVAIAFLQGEKQRRTCKTKLGAMLFNSGDNVPSSSSLNPKKRLRLMTKATKLADEYFTKQDSIMQTNKFVEIKMETEDEHDKSIIAAPETVAQSPPKAAHLELGAVSPRRSPRLLSSSKLHELPNVRVHAPKSVKGNQIYMEKVKRDKRLASSSTLQFFANEQLAGLFDLLLQDQAHDLKSILLQWCEDTDNTAIDFPFKAYEDEEFEPLPSELHPMLTLYDFSCCVRDLHAWG